MAKNFRASQVSTNQIITSGSNGTNAKLLIYPIDSEDSSSPNQGQIDSNAFNTGSIGADTFLFVSGAIGSKDSSNSGTAVFGGDVYISGTLHSVSFNIPLSASDIINDSNVSGSTVKDALNTLSGSSGGSGNVSEIEPFITSSTLVSFDVTGSTTDESILTLQSFNIPYTFGLGLLNANVMAYDGWNDRRAQFNYRGFYTYDSGSSYSTVQEDFMSFYTNDSNIYVTSSINASAVVDLNVVGSGSTSKPVYWRVRGTFEILSGSGM